MAIVTLSSALIAITIGPMLSGVVQLYPPLWNAYQKWALQSWPNVNPQINELVEMLHRGEISKQEFTDTVEEYGLSAENSEKLFNISIRLLLPQDYVTLWRRGRITEDECNNQLRKSHLSEREVKEFKQVTEFFPSPPDLVRFAVREVYNPEILQAFGALDDLPSEFINESFKAGLPEEQAKNYWAAHWELPSLLMGFDMLHRRIIDKDQLTMLMKALDIMPGWRDSLTKLSYKPLTRVDVRRMFDTNVLNEEEVNNAYLDVGYSPENAERMTEFTKVYTSNEMSGVTRSSIMSSFKRGIITKEELKSYLEAFGYSEKVVNFWLQMATFEKEEEVLELITDEIKSRYRSGMITLRQAKMELETYDLPASYVNEIISKLKIQESVRVKLPSKGDLENWLKIGVINDETFHQRMLQIGYKQIDIELYMSEITIETGEKEKPEYLKQTTYDRWFKTDLIDEKRYRFILSDMGFSDQDVDLSVQEIRQIKAAKQEE